jgi:hypothetical protein
MSVKRAKTRCDQQARSLLVVAPTRNLHRNKPIVLLSLKAGVWAGEIAKLTQDMAIGPAGEFGFLIVLCDIQLLAGHRSIQPLSHGDSDAQRKLVSIK